MPTSRTGDARHWRRWDRHFSGYGPRTPSRYHNVRHFQLIPGLNVFFDLTGTSGHNDRPGSRPWDCVAFGGGEGRSAPRHAGGESVRKWPYRGAKRTCDELSVPLVNGAVPGTCGKWPVLRETLFSGTATSPAARNRTRLFAIPGRFSQCLRRALRFWLTARSHQPSPDRPDPVEPRIANTSGLYDEFMYRIGR
jgi:hypothetical protein